MIFKILGGIFLGWLLGVVLPFVLLSCFLDESEQNRYYSRIDDDSPIIKFSYLMSIYRFNKEGIDLESCVIDGKKFRLVLFDEIKLSLWKKKREKEELMRKRDQKQAEIIKILQQKVNDGLSKK